MGTTDCNYKPYNDLCRYVTSHAVSKPPIDRLALALLFVQTADRTMATMRADGKQLSLFEDDLKFRRP